MIDLSTFSPRRILVCQLRQIGDVVLADAAGTGVAVVATKEVAAK